MSRSPLATLSRSKLELLAVTTLFWSSGISRKPFSYGAEGRRLLGQIDRRRRRMTLEEYLAHVYAGSLACYLEEPRVYGTVVLYERLVDDPESVVGDLMSRMGLSRRRHLRPALEAMEADSQGGVLGSRGQWRRESPISPEKWREIDGVLDKFGTGLRHDMTTAEFEAVFALSGDDSDFERGVGRGRARKSSVEA